MRRHVKAVHDGVKNILCTQPGCNKTFSAKQKMLKHVKAVHDRIKDIECTDPDCDKMFSEKFDMLKHVKAVHDGVKDIECTRPDCGQMFAQRAHMLRHISEVHEGIKEIECTHPDCDRTFSQQINMINHVKTVHDGVKDIKCSEDGCETMFSSKQKMLLHVKAIHSGLKDIECTDSTCNKMFSDRSNMLRHVKAVHNGIKDVECADPDCTQKFSTNQEMRIHYDCWHTVEGQQKKIRKQDRVRQVLESAYTVDSECHVRYQGGCVPDPDKFCARIDYHVLGITNAIVIVECDEQGHKDYTLTCELSRMEQIHEAIIKANFSMVVAKAGEAYALTASMKPVVFVRFNPDPWKVDGEKELSRRCDREAVLLEVLQDISDGTLELPHPLNLVYIGYSMLDGEPVVCGDPDFAPQMRGCVVLAV
ncbi:hypothetical protein JKP88DRAFT_272668 [Tribonema minus]|uniref:C2H2-type domain-containing protein n=1 Tax=Tribonema minus TaxID=303371 RepID=A0A835Z3M2_9STRA|nr:hypothetical protein JKP88DRAFT_272668 [Tribonema minus]